MTEICSRRAASSSEIQREIAFLAGSLYAVLFSHPRELATAAAGAVESLASPQRACGHPQCSPVSSPRAPFCGLLLRSAKGAARTTASGKELPAPHSVLREFLKSAKGAARTTASGKELPAPHSVLREFLKSAKGAARTTASGKELPAPHSVLREFLKSSPGTCGSDVEERLELLAAAGEAAMRDPTRPAVAKLLAHLAGQRPDLPSLQIN